MTLGACSSDDKGGSSGTVAEGGPNETGTGSDGGTDSGGGADAAVTVINDCKNFVDRTAAGAMRTIAWSGPPLSVPERCMTIKKGQDVTWNGSLSSHPLAPKDGDVPNPVIGVDANGKVTFPNAGLFGYECGIHPGMIGAIKVIE